jgi:hypothetical protein
MLIYGSQGMDLRGATAGNIIPQIIFVDQQTN